MDDQALTLDELANPVERVAVAYAPARVRALWLGLLALDSRLKRAARSGSEPVLAQIKLAWWRDRFAGPIAAWPAGEPLLAVLTRWDGETAALGELVDGWEAAEVGEDGGVRLRAARVEAVLALARLAGGDDDPAEVRRAALDWLDGEAAGASPRLSRAMRPLAVLRGMALRGYGQGLGQGQERGALRSFFAVMRLGLLGR